MWSDFFTGETLLGLLSLLLVGLSGWLRSRESTLAARVKELETISLSVEEEKKLKESILSLKEKKVAIIQKIEEARAKHDLDHLNSVFDEVRKPVQD